MQHRIDINDEKWEITDQMVEVKKIRLGGLYMILNSKESGESLIPKKINGVIDYEFTKKSKSWSK